MRFAKPIIICVVSLALMIAVCGIAGPFIKRCLPSFSDAYASDWASIFIIDHIRTSGEWPKGWHDLRDEYDRLADADHYAWTFDEFQDRVWINWSARLDDVRNADPPMEVFRLASGRRISYNGDPNLLIREYLRTGKDPFRVDPPIKHGG
ncbi:hypothetical protein [Roseimaritima ulvae]|uniref:Uncharacterized protein n=1 Tax=Roseimaritima ulvae TaxID=980254 RepID=A0A5B9QM53_9BACT|nr:hypothetical protein [Roseimaritima ulvae]QEG40187.1 hypothetical protein UC8_21930 [Roseimaritima ulvae]